MKGLIELVLQPLVGQQIWHMRRYLGAQRFEFGSPILTTNRKGREVLAADTALVVSTYWEITGPDGHIVGSIDFGPEDERRDSEEAHAFYRLLPVDRIWVQHIEGREDGGFHLQLNHGFIVTSLPSPHEPAQISARERERRYHAFEDDELWRFMPNFITCPEKGHFIGTPLGICGNWDEISLA